MSGTIFSNICFDEGLFSSNKTENAATEVVYECNSYTQIIKIKSMLKPCVVWDH